MKLWNILRTYTMDNHVQSFTRRSTICNRQSWSQCCRSGVRWQWFSFQLPDFKSPALLFIVMTYLCQDWVMLPSLDVVEISQTPPLRNRTLVLRKACRSIWVQTVLRMGRVARGGWQKMTILGVIYAPNTRILLYVRSLD